MQTEQFTGHPATPLRARRFLSVEELAPSVQLASCDRFERVLFRYRVPAHHLLLVVSGELEAHTPDGKLEAQAGDLVCFRPTDWNECGTRSVAFIYQAHLQFAPPPKHLLTPVLGEFGPLPTRVALGDFFEEARRVFEIFCLEITQEGVQHQLSIRSAVDELLAILASVLQHDVHRLAHLDPWQRLRLRLDSELNVRCNVAQLAREMRLSRRYFSLIFRQRFGLTPKAYHIRARLQKAARLLRDSDKPIKEIAFDLGFKDGTIFTRHFKRHLGIPPSDIRLSRAFQPFSSGPIGDHLFPTNTNMVPPQSGPDWISRYIPRKRPRDYAMMTPFNPGRKQNSPGRR